MCVCEIEREKCCEGCWGQGHYKGSVCVGHGTVLAGTHVHIHACTHSCQKQWLIVDAEPSWVHALQSHIVSPAASLSLPFSYLCLSLSITNNSVFLPQLLPFTFNFVSLQFPDTRDLMFTLHLYIQLTAVSVAALVPFFSSFN